MLIWVLSMILTIRDIFNLHQTSLFLPLGWFWLPEFLCNCHPALEPSLCFRSNTFNRTLNSLRLRNISLRCPSVSRDHPPSTYSSSGNNSTNSASSSQPLRMHHQTSAHGETIRYLKHHFPSQQTNFQYTTCSARPSRLPHTPHLSSLWFWAPPVLWVASLSFSLSLTVADLLPLSPAAPRRPQKLCLPAGPSLICHRCC